MKAIIQAGLPVQPVCLHSGYDAHNEIGDVKALSHNCGHMSQLG